MYLAVLSDQRVLCSKLVGLHELSEACSSLLRCELKLKSVEVFVHVTPRTFFVRADRAQLIHLGRKMVLSVLEGLDHHQTIHLTAAIEEDGIVWTVRNTNELQRLFFRFPKSSTGPRALSPERESAVKLSVFTGDSEQSLGEDAGESCPGDIIWLLKQGIR
jgi:hypothetical protein